MGELSKEEAAKYLGCSARQVERYASENRLGVRYVKGRAKPSPRYDEGELARFKAELERTVERPAVQVLGPEEANRHEPTGQGSALSLPVALDGAPPEALQVLAGQMLAALLQAAQGQAQAQRDTNRQGDVGPASLPVASSDALKPQVLVSEKLLLDLAEAQALTGLSRAHLRAAITSGEMSARLIGRGWKIRRFELERYLEATC